MRIHLSHVRLSAVCVAELPQEGRQHGQTVLQNGVLLVKVQESLWF